MRLSDSWIVWFLCRKIGFLVLGIGGFSFGNWIWNSSKTVIIPQYDSLNISFDAKGVHVGDAAQTAIAGSIRYEPFKNFYVKMQCQYFDRYYSNFDPFTLQGSNGGRESWMMPSYLLVNFFTGYKYSFEKSNTAEIPLIERNFDRISSISITCNSLMKR